MEGVLETIGDNRAVRVVSIQIGRVQACAGAGGPSKTAIGKTRVEGSIHVGRLGFDGDEIADHRHHGGPERAVLFASRSTYPIFEARLGRTLAMGAFGENLTVEGLSDADVAIGDRLRVGEAEFEVSSPRIPCGTLARHLADPGIVNAIAAPHRAGWYARVVREGTVVGGDPVTTVARPNPTWTIARVAAAKQAVVEPDVARTIAGLVGLGSDWVAKFRQRADGKA